MANRSPFSFHYIGGSVAESLEGISYSNAIPQELPHSPALPPRLAQPKERVIRVDLVSLAGLVLSVILAASMLAAGMGFYESLEARDAAQAQVQLLQQEQAQLRTAYEAGYDLEAVRQKALDMGMIPISEAKTVPLEVPAPAEELTFWQWFRDYFTGLFA